MAHSEQTQYGNAITDTAKPGVGEAPTAPKTGICPRVRLAVYDFDGTSITGNSPVMLFQYLFRRHMLRPNVTLHIMAWAFKYKFRLPQNESWVRSLVFTAFEGKPKAEVDDYLKKFYEEEVAERYRAEADASMQAHRDEGCVVMVVSATWEAIVERAMQDHPFQFYVATRMRVDAQGNYTREVEGMPVEGQEKVSAVQRFADGKYGEGNWELAYAYGDHHSDLPLLQAAVSPAAVTPDNPLERAAKANGWPILQWEKTRHRSDD